MAPSARFRRLAPYLLCVVSVAAWLVAFHPWRWYMGDLVVYRGGGLSLLHGRGLYDIGFGRSHLHFTYPPFAALTVLPLAVVPLAVAKCAISLATAGAIWSTLKVVAKRIGQEGRPLPRAVVPAFFAGAIWLEPVRATLSFGQINAVLMALIALDVLVLSRSRWGGVLIGVSAAIKLTPLAFVLYLAVVGRGRDAARALVTFAACAAVGFGLDFHASRSYWLGHRFLAAHRIGRVENASNQSIHGILARALRTADVPSYWVVLAALAFGLLLALAVLLHRRGLESRALIVVAMAMLLASPISWSHHWVWCAPMSLVLVDIVRSSRRPITALLCAMVVLPFALALVFWAPHARHLELQDTVPQQLASATYVLAGTLFAALMWLDLLRARRDGRDVPPAPHGGSTTRPQPITKNGHM